ncbi:MAG: D-alanyl-D-alanine carboxypeptidase [Bacilli bacterium]|nr:D-alanyl-D-alanine carboxypeptidase [Bacilli bacterium]
MKKGLIIVICLIMLCPFLNCKADVSENIENTFENTESLAVNAQSAILIDAKTGTILYEKNAHEKLAPASMTKIMSMLIIVEAIEKGNLKWDEMLTISENASSMGGSQILLETGEQMSVKDLFKGVAVASGNDAVIALAEAVAGTMEEFVKMMNEKVKKLNLKDTNFKNPHGLDEANHYSSAYDMAFIAKELVKHEKILTFTSIYEDYLRKGTEKEFWLTNTNKLTRFKPGVDGLKTGYTEEAGYCLTATMQKNDYRLIATVMKEPSSTIRNSEISTLLDYGYAQYKSVSILSSKDIISKASVEKGINEYSNVVAKEDVNLILKKSDNLGKITYDIDINKLKAPIKKGQIIGKIVVNIDNKKTTQIDLTVNKDNEKATFFKLYFRYLKNIINGKIYF